MAKAALYPFLRFQRSKNSESTFLREVSIDRRYQFPIFLRYDSVGWACTHGAKTPCTVLFQCFLECPALFVVCLAPCFPVSFRVRLNVSSIVASGLGIQRLLVAGGIFCLLFNFCYFFIRIGTRISLGVRMLALRQWWSPNSLRIVCFSSRRCVTHDSIILF